LCTKKMTLSTSAASKKWKKIHKATMTVYIDALWIFFYRLFMLDAFVLLNRLTDL